MSASYRYLVLGCFASETQVEGRPVAIFVYAPAGEPRSGISRIVSPNVFEILSCLDVQPARWALRLLFDADAETESNDPAKLEELFRRLASLRVGPLRALNEATESAATVDDEAFALEVFADFLSDCEGSGQFMLDPKYAAPILDWLPSSLSDSGVERGSPSQMPRERRGPLLRGFRHLLASGPKVRQQRQRRSNEASPFH